MRRNIIPCRAFHFMEFSFMDLIRVINLSNMIYVYWFVPINIRATAVQGVFLFSLPSLTLTKTEINLKILFTFLVRSSLFSALMDNPSGNTKFWIRILFSTSPPPQQSLIFLAFSTTFSICFLWLDDAHLPFNYL